MTQPNREPANREPTGSADIIDDALRLVDALQRKLLIAGVRRGVSSATSPPPRKGDVWEEAIRHEQPAQPRPPIQQLAGIARAKGPEVVTHLGKAGAALFGALGETWGVVEQALERQRSEQREHSGSEPGQASGGPAEIERPDAQ